jgi:glycosyltransferase involved in cell wall biosynthesis/SAM-dependent methyltransferase
VDRLSIVFHLDSVPFTPAVIDGTASLGGSESACLGLGRALKARGHDVHFVATRMAEDAPAVDAWGVAWHRSEDLPATLPLLDADVFVALRSPQVFGLPVQARFRMLWNQDMLVGDPVKLPFMPLAWAYDALAYVSEYQRRQWEGVSPELKPLGWVTRNGFDPTHVPTDVQKVPGRIIHISRPERGLAPLLQMWPELKKRVPHAELQVCRYQSMYDGEGSNVKAMCEHFDKMVAQVNGQVGGITYLGSLGKRDLYRAIAEAEVMWYPGVVDFAETSCIAAIESQACGTPFVGSYKGALPETVPFGILIEGDAMSPEYQRQSIDAVGRILASASDEWGDVRASINRAYSSLAVTDGRKHVQSYTYDAIAAEWETYLWGQFDARSRNTAGVVAQLLHEDDHVAAKALAIQGIALHSYFQDVVAECERVEKGEAQTAVEYAKFALDPEAEMTTHRHPRMDKVIQALDGCVSILDLACGNGSHAIALAKADETRIVHGIDYAGDNIAAAKAAAERLGVGDRIRFDHLTVCDLQSGVMTDDAMAVVTDMDYDAVFLGEFCEHVAGVTTLLSDLRLAVGDGARVVITVPSGPFSDMLDPDTPKQKGHVHHFRPRDLTAIFGDQRDCVMDFLDCGTTPRGVRVGHWIISFTTSDVPFGERPLAHWHRTIRPKQTLSVGILAHDCTPDLARCLNDVWWVADQIVIADCGSRDRIELERLATRYHATLLDLPHVGHMTQGFAEARNATLQASTGDWFLWIDADEQLIGFGSLRHYLESGIYTGYAIKQNHLMLDAPQHFDTPIRLFRRQPNIAFYGCVHEQPQMGDCNGDITPALQVHDVQIAHTGYMHEGIRRGKATRRNLPLLVRDREEFPDRRLGLVLVLRDLVNQALWRAEQRRGELDAESKDLFLRAVALFEQHFMDPADKFHSIARPFYETALRLMPGAMEVFFAEGGAVGGMKGRTPKVLTWWVRESAHRHALIEYEREKIRKSEAPLVVDVEPVRQEVSA